MLNTFRCSSSVCRSRQPWVTVFMVFIGFCFFVCLFVWSVETWFHLCIEDEKKVLHNFTLKNSSLNVLDVQKFCNRNAQIQNAWNLKVNKINFTFISCHCWHFHWNLKSPFCRKGEVNFVSTYKGNASFGMCA